MTLQYMIIRWIFYDRIILTEESLEMMTRYIRSSEFDWKRH